MGGGKSGRKEEGREGGRKSSGKGCLEKNGGKCGSGGSRENLR